MEYPLYGEIDKATDEQIYEWFFNLPNPSTRNEATKWAEISERHYRISWGVPDECN